MLPWSPRRFLVILAALFFLNWALVQVFAPGEERIRVPYNPTFLTEVRDGNVKEISSRGDTVQGEFKKDVTYEGDKAKKFETELPTFADDQEVHQLLTEKGVVINAQSPSSRSLLETILFSFGPTILLVALFVFLARRAAGAGGGAGGMLGQFGRSRAKRVESETQTVNFDDVAGIDEAEEQLIEVVDFLRNPDKYLRLGARIPRGVLLAGPPGTGKTLLARAVAGEAGVPFFSASASEFIEAIVGVGASRVRDLFKQAEEAAPAIIFIDELDAIGRARGGGGGFGGHDEREQTLNQILTEMDGFDPAVGVIVLGATNRPDVLDPALLRPGRFDRRVFVQPPDSKGREEILRVHTRSVPLAPEVDLARIAQSTPGMVGAELANLVNEAALLAVRREHDKVTQADFTDALEMIVLGAERKIVLGAEDRRRIAYHEGGHAIVGMLTPGADPVRKVSIIPRGQALGVTLSTPEDDRFNYSEHELRAKIRVAAGGRVAEELVYDEPTTGAESDIQHVTGLARGMVERWGMSERVGFLAVAPSEGQGLLLPGADPVSEATKELIDHEVRRIVDEELDHVRRLLTEHRERLDALAEALLDRETLDELDAYAAAGIPREREPASA
ncbi:MAG: cell division protease FtsH [Thermoleophilaceae bacterium]|nr:cell division protease FtsH [Thermoleophilaceae bacterium]